MGYAAEAQIGIETALRGPEIAQVSHCEEARRRRSNPRSQSKPEKVASVARFRMVPSLTLISFDECAPS
jgi:hypothetical protein